MIAITLNLLAEELQAEQARARDPLKVGIAIGASLVAITVAVGAVLGFMANKKHSEVAALQVKWDEHQGKLAGPSAGFAAVKNQAETLMAINHARILCAPQLALIKDLVPETINLNRLGFTLITEVSQAGVPPADTPAASADPDTSKAKARRPAGPGGRRHLVLQIEGKAISPRPEIEVDKFIQSLHATPTFNDQVTQIQLRSIARATGGGEAGTGAMPSAFFVIECQFKEKS